METDGMKHARAGVRRSSLDEPGEEPGGPDLPVKAADRLFKL
jgi:hypothetical protein